MKTITDAYGTPPGGPPCDARDTHRRAGAANNGLSYCNGSHAFEYCIMHVLSFADVGAALPLLSGRHTPGLMFCRRVTERKSMPQGRSLLALEAIADHRVASHAHAIELDLHHQVEALSFLSFASYELPTVRLGRFALMAYLEPSAHSP